MNATQRTNGQALDRNRAGVDRPDGSDLKNPRFSAVGKALQALPEAHQGVVADEAADQTTAATGGAEDRDLRMLSFLGVGVAMAAILAGHGYHELGGYCANRCGERAATLSVPQRDGGHIRYRVEFPETMRLDAERVE